MLCHSPDNPFAKEIAVYDQALGDTGLPSVPVFAYMPGLAGERRPRRGFRLDALHFLRRAYLLKMCGLEVAPVDQLGSGYEQLLEMFEATAQQSHLVWHYDHAGVYVPVDFTAPFSNDDLLAGGGPLLGSTQGLLRELEFVAPSIGTDPANPPAAPKPDRPTSLEEPAAAVPFGDGPFGRERHVWLGLHAGRYAESGAGIDDHLQLRVRGGVRCPRRRSLPAPSKTGSRPRPAPQASPGSATNYLV